MSDRVHESPPPGYRTQSTDVVYWAEKELFERLTAMDDRETFELIRALHRSAERLVLRGLQEQYPDATEEELDRQAAKLRLGHDAVERLVALESSNTRSTRE